MYLIHVRFRSASAAPVPLCTPVQRAGVLASVGVEHLTEYRGEEPGTVVLTLFVRASSLPLAELRARAACLPLDAVPWRLDGLWPGMVAEYYEKLLTQDKP
ncbi:hypothetical protein AB0G79_20800 [Streptomyces sp. NPDC020807]|uniref:hypothetical protein n=1 Tax=Streptomyces sp. NPDC020807 TaxID=3155119 RepID=UPI003409F78C